HLDMDVDAPAARSELDGIAQQIEEHLLEPPRVHADLRQRGRQMMVQPEAGLGGHRLHGAQDVDDERTHLNVHQLELDALGLDLDEIEQIVDQAEEVTAAGQDVFQ